MIFAETRLHACLRGLESSLRGIVGLFGNGVDLQQGLGALRIGLSLNERSARLRERSFGALQSRFIFGRIDLIELIACFHFLAFGKEALLEDAVHLRTDFGDIVSVRATRQNRFNLDWLGLGRNDLHLRRRHFPRCSSRPRSTLLFAACQRRSSAHGANKGGIKHFSM